jgi:hypothetical protein
MESLARRAIEIENCDVKMILELLHNETRVAGNTSQLSERTDDGETRCVPPAHCGLG